MAQLFRRKPIAEARAEVGLDPQAVVEPGLRRSLTAWQLTALGIGAIIGAGIFSGAGTAVAGGPNHLGAGPALVISYILVAVACGFAALCYAEFASLIPQSGSAYTYAYATLGELVAWIIGWDLIIEYAVGNIAVAVSWSATREQYLVARESPAQLLVASDHHDDGQDRIVHAWGTLLVVAPRLGVVVEFLVRRVFACRLGKEDEVVCEALLGPAATARDRVGGLLRALLHRSVTR